MSEIKDSLGTSGKANPPKKAMIIYLTSNEVELKDSEAIATGFQKIGYETEVYRIHDISKDDLYKEKDWGSYSFVGFFPDLNGLWHSNKNRKACMKHIFENSRDEALSFIVCDTTFNIDVHMWDKGEDSKDKEKVFCYKPLKVIGSFSKSILESESGMKLINQRYMNKLHPDSKFIPLEWLAFHIYDLPQEMKRKIELSEELKDTVYPDGVPEVNGFYYGFRKPKIAKELKLMGLGDSPKDGVFGEIGRFFTGDEYPDIQRFGQNIKQRQPEYWIPLAQNAKKLYVPYDPVKGDFQFTKRFLEVALLKEDPSEIEASPKIAEEIREYLAVDKWESKAKEVEQELKELYG